MTTTPGPRPGKQPPATPDATPQKPNNSETPHGNGKAVGKASQRRRPRPSRPRPSRPSRPRTASPRGTPRHPATTDARGHVPAQGASSSAGPARRRLRRTHRGDRAVPPHDHHAGRHRLSPRGGQARRRLFRAMRSRGSCRDLAAPSLARLRPLPSRAAAGRRRRTRARRRWPVRVRRALVPQASGAGKDRRTRGALAAVRGTGSGRRAVDVVQLEQRSAGAEDRVGALPELAGLPEATGLGVPDRGDGNAHPPGKLRLGQPVRPPPARQPRRQGARRGREVALGGRLRRAGDTGAGVAARPRDKRAVRDQHTQRLSAGQRRVTGDAAERRAAWRRLTWPQGTVGDLSADGLRHARVFRHALTVRGHGAGVSWSILGYAASMPLQWLRLGGTVSGELQCHAS